MEKTLKRRWYLVYSDKDSRELNKRFTSWFDGQTQQDHHFEQVVRCYPSMQTPCVCAEHYGNIDCVPMLNTVFFITSIETTAVNRSWIDTYSVSVNESPVEIGRQEFNNLMRHCQGLPIAKYNVIIPTENEQGVDTTLMSFYKGLLGGLCVIEKEYATGEALEASRQERYPWVGLFAEASDPALLDDPALARCVVERDFDGNGYLRPLGEADLQEAKAQRGHLYDEFVVD